MISGCEALLKAIDAYIAKDEKKLGETLSTAGFADAARTAKEMASLEDRVAQVLMEETDYIITAASQAGNLTAFAAAWDDIKLNDNLDVKLRAVFIEELETLIPRLTTSYMAETDPELAEARVVKAIDATLNNEAVASTITKRTTAWVDTWSSELGELMKLSSHDEIQKILVDGLRNGQGVNEFTRALLDSGIRDEYYKARRVALTETLRAHSVAQQEAFTQNPAVSEKEWRHTGSYRNTPRENHVDMDGKYVSVNEAFTLYGTDGSTYYPMYPRDSSLPPGESVNCHCICQPRVDQDILGLSLEERRAMQAQAIAEDDGEWEKELDAKNRARAGIEETPREEPTAERKPFTSPEKSDIIDYGYTNTADRRAGDSLSLFTDAKGQLTVERDALHKQLIDETFAGVTPVEGKATFTVMGGGSAAGKSTMINSGAVTLPANSVMLDSDALKTKLPEYIKMVAAGDDTAAAFAHEESSALVKRMLGIANSGNYNAVLDGTGDGSVASLTKKIMDAKNAGMAVNGVYATVPTETALERSMLRAAKTGRMVPVDDIINIHRKVSEILPQCASLFDSVELYDTQGDAILIATGGNGLGLTAVPGQESLFEAFLAKALK